MKDCDYFGYYPDVYSEANNKKLMKPPTTFYISFFNVCAVKPTDNSAGDSLGCEKILKRLIENGHTIVCTEIDYNALLINWFKERELEVRFMNDEDIYDMFLPQNIIITQNSLGVPLIYNEKVSYFPYICWYKVEEYLRINGYI